jgi:hypothetical protein
MRPAAGDVLHFSEDPTIQIFRPHVARTAAKATPWSGIRLRNARP